MPVHGQNSRTADDFQKDPHMSIMVFRASRPIHRVDHGDQQQTEDSPECQNESVEARCEQANEETVPHVV